MLATSHLRFLRRTVGLCLLLPATVAMVAQRSSLPATPATSTAFPPDGRVAAPINATSPATIAHHGRRATVVFHNGLLTVLANDSGLSQILRQVAEATGMTITGSVADQRVFGVYGPDSPSTVLTTLLDGTGTNVLYAAAQDGRPATLVLTQRLGGPTPPAEPTIADDNDDDGNSLPHPNNAPPGAPPPPIGPPGFAQRPMQRRTAAAEGQLPGQATSASGQATSASGQATSASPPSIPQPLNNVLGSPANVTPTASQIPTTNSVPISSLPTPSTTTSNAQGIVDTPNPPQPGGINPLSPSAVQQGVDQQSATGSPTDSGAATTPAPTVSNSDSTTSSADSSGKAKTPEQILQELQQLMKNQQPQS